MEWRHTLHATVYCSAISPCGNYLAVGNNFGFIAIFNLTSALSPKNIQEDNNVSKPIFVFAAHNGPVHALASAKLFLLSGGAGPVCAWRWNDLANCKAVKAFSLSTTSSSQTALSQIEEDSNCLYYDCTSEILFTGGNTCTVTAFDVASGNCINVFDGHEQFIHDLTLASYSLITASEDGCVKVSLPNLKPVFYTSYVQGCRVGGKISDADLSKISDSNPSEIPDSNS